jgi:hypothetical protein
VGTYVAGTSKVDMTQENVEYLLPYTLLKFLFSLQCREARLQLQLTMTEKSRLIKQFNLSIVQTTLGDIKYLDLDFGLNSTYIHQGSRFID